MGLSLRSNGYYIIDFYDNQKNRHKISLKTKDKQLAEKLYQEFMYERVKAKLSSYAVYSSSTPSELPKINKSL
ncbi:MAG: hypothetical protein ACRCY4_00095 [Brevinema sp.]